MSSYHDRAIMPSDMQAYDINRSRQRDSYDSDYQPRRSQREWPPPSTNSYDHEDDYDRRRSRRPGYRAQSPRSYDTRSTHTAESPLPTARQRQRSSLVVAGLLTGLAVVAFTGMHILARRISENSQREQRRRERAFELAKRQRRREEERREREEQSLDGEEEWARPENRRRIEYYPPRRERTPSTAVRRIEAPRSHEDDYDDDEYDHVDDYYDHHDDDRRTVRRHDDDRWKRSRRDDR